MKTAPFDTKKIVQNISSTVLSKSTLRASDYRKAIILIHHNLRTNEAADPNHTELFRTAAEMSETFYSHASEKTQVSVLWLHNNTFVHAKLCKQLFGDAIGTSLFGRYFHSIVSHSPLLYRIISLRSINTEMQERYFGQAKQITSGTSNKKPDHVLENIIIRLQQETKCLTSSSLCTNESEIGKLA